MTEVQFQEGVSYAKKNLLETRILTCGLIKSILRKILIWITKTS